SLPSYLQCGRSRHRRDDQVGIAQAVAEAVFRLYTAALSPCHHRMAMAFTCQQNVEDRDFDSLPGKISREDSADFSEADNRDSRNGLGIRHGCEPAQPDRRAGQKHHSKWQPESTPRHEKARALCE